MASNLEVVISATDRFSATANRVIGTLGRMEGAAGRVGKGVGQLGLGLARVAIVGATAAVGGLIAVAKAGIDFQDAMAGVSKTVAGTPDQIAAIGRELLAISTTIPVTATDLAAIAQELGALNVPREDIANTARIIAELSAATVGLTTDAAAEAFGKLGNVLNVHGADVERFASSLVALGNAGASSEGDIIAVAVRFGAAASQAKLSAAETLGFASAIASLGVEPEAAGSSLSRLFNNVTKYIGTGDAKLKAFAKTAGLSVKDFSKFFARDAAGAMELFLQKLGGLDRFTASKVLKDAGITNVRDINAVLLLSQHYGELKRQVDLSTQSWIDNTELQETAAKRFDSVKSKLTVLANTIRAGAIVMANEFLPAVGRSVTKLTDFLKLPSTGNELKSLGRDIAAAIDGIDWGQVVAGVRTFAGILKDAAVLLSKIPIQITAAVAAFIGLNKLSGGLIGAGIGNIAGGLAGGAARGLAAKIPGIGAVFAQPVFVTNWPVGGLGGAGGVGGAGALTFLGAGLPVLAAVAGYIAFMKANVPEGTYGQDAPGSNTNRYGYAPGHTPPVAPMTEIEKIRDAIESAKLAEATGANATNAKLAIVRNSIESSKIAGVSATRSGTAQIVGAIQRNRPIVNVKVNFNQGDTIRVTKNYQSGRTGSGYTGGQQEKDR